MKKVGGYVLISELGKGQFGTVYKAKQEETGDIFAMKTVKKLSIQANARLKTLFDTEIHIMSKIKHPNILHLYEYLETNNNFYLVIDFCNNGDMETHLKKHQFLGEEESVYFLMQVMNGFKELHKHKIMHRDFKLANIFLNDDKLIIGDFGFAKTGVDMTSTKLGSPITMAPEMLLNTGSKLQYTNKADLWSIGVCFYQMIFGKLPWDVVDLDDLKQKVKEQSGQNLQFPSDKCVVSSECKDLLIKLLEIDPKKRIEWDDFFHHKLFSAHQQKKKQKENALNMRQSVMFRNNEDQVQQLFDQNKTKNEPESDLTMEPEDIKLDPSVDKPGPVVTIPEKLLERIKARVIARYTHEKKTVVFFMYTCRKLRNLAKERDTFKKAANGLMYLSIMLLRKGIIMNQIAIESLRLSEDKYCIEGFAQFTELPDKKKLLDELEGKDNVLYTKLFSHLKDKIKEEVGSADQRTQEVIKLVEDPNYSLKALEAELRKETYFIVQYFSKTLSKLTDTLKYDMMMALAHLYTATHHETYLAFMTESVPFDWNEFDKSWNDDEGVEKMNRMLNIALTNK